MQLLMFFVHLRDPLLIHHIFPLFRNVVSEVVNFIPFEKQVGHLAFNCNRAENNGESYIFTLEFLPCAVHQQGGDEIA